MLMIPEVLQNWEPLMFWLFCTHRYSLDIAHSSPSGLLSLALPSQPRVFRTLHFLLSSGYSTHPSRAPLPHWDCFHRADQGPQNYQSRGHFSVFISADLLVAPGCMSLSPSWASLLLCLPRCRLFLLQSWPLSIFLFVLYEVEVGGICSLSTHCLNVGVSPLSVCLLVVTSRWVI